MARQMLYSIIRVRDIKYGTCHRCSYLGPPALYAVYALAIPLLSSRYRRLFFFLTLFIDFVTGSPYKVL